MLNIEVDKDEVRRLYVEKLEEHFKDLDRELLFWDTRDLMKQTKLS